MSNTLTYKDFEGTVEFSREDMVFHGKVLGINGLVTFEGDSVKQLTKAFHESVDDYLKTCRKLKVNPEKNYKGSFNVRVKPGIHRLAVLRSAAMKISLNRFIELIIEKEVLNPKKGTHVTRS
ncbi:MAG TPA: type II toxin-antitoxin system HicB family antitoxin [Cyclobacteriaceae bacterium]|nr:type II toxin-antitoxin system HicB family antitoxin [Cyclobacteriaceae bacterium]